MHFKDYILIVLVLSLTPIFADNMQEAAEMLDAGLYTEAEKRYCEYLEDPTIPSQRSKEIRIQLAKTYIALENYPKVIEILDSLTDIDALYLLAVAHVRLCHYQEARKLFNCYLENQSALLYVDEARFEMGLIDFSEYQYEDAYKKFEVLSVGNSRLSRLAEIYLARIYLLQNRDLEAIRLLTQLQRKFPIDDVLQLEICYYLGQGYHQLHEYHQAIACFEKAIPLRAPEKSCWYRDVLYYMGWCYLHLADDSSIGILIQKECLNSAEKSFQKLLDLSWEERGCFALGQCYLLRAKLLNEPEAYQRADSIFSEVHFSKQTQQQALLLRAESAPSYNLRRKLYLQLLDEDPLSAKAWYMHALNDFEEGSLSAENGEKSRLLFSQAASSLERSIQCMQENDQLLGNALKYRALALANCDGARGNAQACEVLELLMHAYSTVWQEMDHPDEVYFLHGFFADKQSRISNECGEEVESRIFADIAERSLVHAGESPQNKYGDQALKHLGAIYYHRKDYLAAEKVYLQLTNNYPISLHCGEAWYWAALCADHLNRDSAIGRERRFHVFESCSSSPYAPEAYFTYYTYQEYLQGGKSSIKHLQNFAARYPNTPFLIEAHFLIGLDCKRDRKTAEGKWIQRKNLTEAIDAFQLTESDFDRLKTEGIIPIDKLSYYCAVRNRARFERAMANFVIADESQGAKRQIYLQYAVTVFNQLLADCQIQEPICQEVMYWLVQTMIRLNDESQAKVLLTKIISIHQADGITQGYYLSLAHYEQGMMAVRNQEYEHALQEFKQADEAGKNLLSTDQKLDLWIQQSLCYRGLTRYEPAILVLSKVVNDDAISALRLKAMLLRAETYEQQGRVELARKQLESLAKKGGAWALKAKEKLEREYGY